MTKGTARVSTNLKPMAGGVAIAQLPVGGWVYGTKGATDLTGFDHFYKANGERVELVKNGVSVMCKAYIGTNLTLKEEEEPTNPPPDPEPDPEDPPVPAGAPDQILARWITGVDASGNITWTEHFVYNRAAE
jgi:hypothetical protein